VLARSFIQSGVFRLSEIAILRVQAIDGFRHGIVVRVTAATDRGFTRSAGRIYLRNLSDLPPILAAIEFISARCGS
jgi:hypothetical protein